MARQDTLLPPPQAESDQDSGSGSGAGPQIKVETRLDGSVRIHHPLFRVSVIGEDYRNVEMMMWFLEEFSEAIDDQRTLTIERSAQVLEGIFSDPSVGVSSLLKQESIDAIMSEFKQRCFLQSIAQAIHRTATEMYDERTADRLLRLLTSDSLGFETQQEAFDLLEKLTRVFRQAFPGQNLLEAPEE